LIAWCKEELHLHHTLRCGDVLTGDRPADRGLMYTDRVGDLHHRHRFKKGCAFIQKIALPFNNLDGDVQDGLLPLMDAFYQKLATPDFFSDVVSDFTAVAALRHQISVGFVDP
jgi:hypothetical protein